jgi:hypothetical protein
LANAGIGVPFAHQVFRLRSITSPAKYAFHAEMSIQLMQSINSRDDNTGLKEIILQCQVQNQLSSFLRHYPDKLELARQYAEDAMATARKYSYFRFDDYSDTSKIANSERRQSYLVQRLLKNLVINLKLSSVYLKRETCNLPDIDLETFATSQEGQTHATVEDWVDHTLAGVRLIDRLFKLRTQMKTNSNDHRRHQQEAIELDWDIVQVFYQTPSKWLVKGSNVTDSESDTMRCVMFAMTLMASLRCLLMQLFPPKENPNFHGIALTSARKILSWLPFM